jgi:hypothetical protein
MWKHSTFFSPNMDMFHMIVLTPPARRTCPNGFDHHNSRKGIVFCCETCEMCGAELVESYRQADRRADRQTDV